MLKLSHQFLQPFVAFEMSSLDFWSKVKSVNLRLPVNNLAWIKSSLSHNTAHYLYTRNDVDSLLRFDLKEEQINTLVRQLITTKREIYMLDYHIGYIILGFKIYTLSFKYSHSHSLFFSRQVKPREIHRLNCKKIIFVFLCVVTSQLSLVWHKFVGIHFVKWGGNA